MNCISNTEKYANLVSKFLKIDPVKFSNFDNVAEFILSNPLKDNSKTNTLHHLAVIYSQLEDASNGEIKKGKAESIKALVNFIGVDDALYLNKVLTDIYPTTKQVSVSKKQIIKQFNKLAAYSELTTMNEELMPLFDLINKYLTFNKFKDTETKKSEIAEFEILYENMIANSSNELALRSLYKSNVREKTSDSNFIALNSIDLSNELNDLIRNRTLLQYKDGRYVDSYFENGNYYDNETGEELDTTDVISRKVLLNDAIVNKKSESFENVLFEFFVSSGINVKDIDQNVQLNTVSNPLSEVTIKAVPIPESTDDRISMFNDIAESDPSYKNLANRKHETFESLQQISHLEKNKDAVVGVLYSPKKSENDFALMGEFNGKRFMIYTLDNYAFLDSNNKTVKIDFTNNEHLTLVAKTFKKIDSNNNNVELTSDDLMHDLKNAFQNFLNFKNDVLNNNELSEALANGETVDVSELFHSYYNVNTTSSKKDYTNLEDALNSDNNQLYTPLEIIDTNTNTKSIVNVPIIGLRRPDIDTFVMYNPLSNNQNVYYNNKSVSFETYVEQVLLKNESFDTYVKSILTKRDQLQHSVLLTFKDNELTDKYRALDINVKNNNILRNFSQFITTLVTSLDSETRTKTLRTFGQTYFQFLNRNSQVSKNAVLNFNFSVGLKNELVLEIRPYGTNDRYNFIQSNKLKYNIPLPEGKIKSIYNELVNEGFSVDAIKKAQESFNDIIEDTVLSALRNPERIDEKFGELFREDFTINDKFVPEYIFFDYDVVTKKRTYLKVYKSKNNKLPLPNIQFENSDIVIVDTLLRKGSIISPKSSKEIVSLPVNITVEKLVAETKETDEKVYEEFINNGGNNSSEAEDIEFDENVPFKLMDPSYDPISAQEQETEIAWLEATYPKFNISSLDLEDIMALTKLNTAVLGFFKDKSVFLNKSLKSKGVVYHEAFHGVFQYLMNDAERRRLLNSIINNKNYADAFTEENITKFAEERNYAFSKEELINRIAEEILANGFQQYMINKKAPTSLIEKFFKLLENIIRMFNSNQRLIDSTFKKVANGYYNTRSMQELANNNVASYLAVPGLNIVYNDAVTSKVKAKPSMLSSSELNQLTNMIVYNIIMNESDKATTFKQKFDQAANTLLDTVYNINVLTAQTDNQTIKKELTDEFGDLYNQYRFVLGARMKGKDVYDINHTGNSKYNTKTYKNQYKDTLLNIVKPNLLGEYSHELLEKLTEYKYNTISSLLIERELDGASISLDEIEAMIPEDGVVAVKDENDFTSEEIDADETESFDNFVEKNTLDSIPRQLKRFLAINTYNLEHPVHKGIYVPRVINGIEIFSSLLKISSDVSYDKIIEQMYNASKTMIEDGNYEIGNDIKTAYENLKRFTGIKNDNEKPVKNKQLFNMFIEALHATSLQYSLFTTEIEKVQENDEDINSPIITRVKSINVKDKVLYEDVNQKKKDIVDQFLVSYSKNYTNPEYKTAISNIKNEINTIKTKSFILESVEDNDNVLLKMTDTLHNNMKKIGLNIPKSLIRLSLIGIDTFENQNNLTIYDQYIKEHYEINKYFIDSNKYLSKKFFNDLYEILSGSPTPETLSESFDDASKKYGGFNSILRRSSEYIIKYDPSSLPSVVRNAEGKLIYRYVKYTPLLHMVKSYNKEGFLNVIKDDVDYEKFLKDFYKNHPTLSVLMVEDKSTLSPEQLELYNRMDAFVRNMNVSLYGGAQLIEGGNVINSASYYNLEKTSSHLLALFSFLKREKIYVGDSFIETYNRQHAQNETSPTNFLISGMHESFANEQGPVLVEGRLKIVETFRDVIAQEYARIAREWANKETYKKDFLKKKSNYLRTGYNAKRKGNDIIVDDKSFKAYNFSKLPKFFQAFSDINELLKDNAFAGNKFEDLSNTMLDNGQSVMDYLLDALNDYALEQYQHHLDVYTASGIIKKIDVVELASPFVTSDNKLIPKQKAGRKQLGSIYTSDYFDKNTSLMIGYDKLTLGDVYGSYNTSVKKYGALNDKGEPVYIIKDFNLENFLMDHVFNHMHNSLLYNQMFDGDESLISKDDVDLIKRNKRFLISGNNFKNGYFRAAFIENLQTFLHPYYARYGHYNSLEEIQNDSRLDNATRAVLEDSFKNGEHRGELADGQSWSTILHQTDQFETMGKLSDQSLNILISKMYRDITEDEFKALQKDRIVLNPKKTATGAKTIYLKLSETYIDRNDVSYIPIPEDLTEEEKLEYLENVYATLHGLYTKMYTNRKLIQEMWNNKDYSRIKTLEKEIRTAAQEAHKYFESKPGRRDLHVMLNSMEYFNIDMVMDNNASKSSKVFPIEFSSQVTDDINYIDMTISSLDISNEYKYNQVETSRMKDESKVSIQRKVLLPADVRHLEKALGRTFEGQELKNYQHILSVLDDYNMAMKESAEAAYNNLRTFLRDENNNYDLGKIYDIIKENLELQNAPDSIKDLFTTDANGKIIINPNIPAVREVIQYYFFALYSKATDEKSSGKKYILASSYGYDMIVDDNDNIIPESELEKNPELYKGFKKRPLTVTTEIDKNGFTRYYIEVLVPKPYFKDAQDELFYLENLNKFFATRIPTANKRSMAMFKAVGFINSAHGNAIIVPQLVHYLSGSDLDIDTVYTQMYNYYENFNNEKVSYGDYNTYANEQEGKFIEYLLYKLKDNDLNNLVKHKIKEIQDTENYKYSEAAKKIAKMLGYNDQQIDIVTTTKKDDLFEVVKMMKQDRDDIFDQISNIKKAADFENLKALAKNKNKVARKKLNELYEVTNPLYERVNQLLQGKSIAYSTFELYYILNKVEAIVKVYSKNKLPVSLTAFNKNKVYANSVRPIAQNKLLKATDELLSNEMMFDNLYINQKSSTENFDNVLTNQGRDYKNVSKIFPYDHHSIAGVINSKSMSQSDKANVGRSATINKTIAFINENTPTGKPNIKDEHVVFKYLVPTFDKKTNKIVYKQVSLDTYGIVDNVDELVIKKVGDAIDMFTDAGKEPKPALLGINDANATFILSALGLGLDIDLAFNLIRLPEFVKATEEVLNSEKTVNINPSGKVSIDAAISKQIKMLKDSNPDAFSKLKAAGLIPATTSEKSNNFTVIKSNVIIEFTPTALDLSKIENNTLSLSDLGITVSALQRKTKDVVKNKKVTTVTESVDVVNLTEEEQKIILLHYIREQNRQSFQLSQISSLVNTLKSLKPSMSSIDFMYNNIKALKNNMLFLTPEVVDNIFSNNKVWNTQLAILEDFMQQAELLFLERSKLFKGMTNLFNTSFKDKSVIASTLATTLAIYKFKKEYPGSRIGINDAQTELIQEDDYNLKETFTASYWFTHGLDIELEELKAKYPNNKFLQYLRTFTTKNFAKTSDGRKFYEKYIGLITKAKIKGDIAKDIADDARVLMITKNLFMNKLYYHELARTSLQYKNNSFLKFLDAGYYKVISSYMNELTDKLKDENINLVETIKNFVNADTQEEFVNVINNVFEVIANTSNDELINYSKPKFYYFDGHINTTYVNKKIETEDKVKKNIEIRNVLSSYLNNIVATSAESPAFIATGNNLLEFNDRNKYVGFDFNYKDADVNDNFKSVIARNFNIKLNPVTLDYVFPSIIKINNRLYLLQKAFTDDSSDIAKSKSLGETFLLDTTYINNEGTKAVYKVLGDSIVNFQTTLNPGSMSKEELTKYSELIKTGKLRGKNLRFLDVEDAVVEEVTEATVQPALKTTKEVKPGVAELFESSPELANAVYETFGFKKKNIQDYKEVVDKQTFQYLDRIQELEDWKTETQPINVKKLDTYIKKIGLGNQKGKYEVNVYENGKEVNKYFNTQEEAINEALEYSNYYTRQYNNILFKSAKDRNDYLDKEIQKVVDKANENEDFRQYYSELLGSEITPQQKQQAQQLYSQYLEQNPNGDIEGFKEFVSTQPTQASVSVSNKKVLKNEKGLIIVNNALSLSETQKVVNDNKQFIEDTSFKQTGGSVSWGYGMQWIRSSALTAKQKEGVQIGKQIGGQEVTQSMVDQLISGVEPGKIKGLPLYVYTIYDINGNRLPNIPSEIIDILQKQGINVSQYDASYNSVYDKTDKGSLIVHQDNTEFNTSPIVTVSMGRPMKFITYQLKDSKDYSFGTNKKNQYELTLNTISNKLVSQKLAPELKRQKNFSGVEVIAYGELTPGNLAKYAKMVGMESEALDVLANSIEKIDEQILTNGAVLVFSKENRNVFHEIIFDEETDKLPMPSGFPELTINKAYKGLGHKDKMITTKDYRVVLTLRKVLGTKELNIVDESKLTSAPTQTPVSTMTLKEYADKTSVRFVDAKEVLRKSDIEYYNDRVTDLIEGRLQYALFADLNDKQYLPFINKLKENGFIPVKDLPYILSKNGINPFQEYERLFKSTQASVSGVKGNIQLELIEDLVQQGIAKTTVRNYDRPSGIYKSAKTENLYNLVNRGKVRMVGDKIVGKSISYTLDEFGAAEGFGNWEGFTKAAKYAGKDLMAGKEVFLYDITAAGVKADKSRPVFDTLPDKSSTPTMTYAGIGSRETPKEVMDQMTELAKELESRGYTLRSGGAKGADTAFERGVTSKKEIFPGGQKAGEREMKIAREIHPNPEALDNSKNPPFVWNLMARNTNQVFGKNLDTPVDFVIAYTQDGLTDYTKRSIKSGGTGQAIDMASRKGIPVINLANPNWRQELDKVLSTPTQPPVSQPAQKVYKLGQYVSYKEDVFIVTKVLDDGKYQIYNPTKEGAQAKLAVKPESITPYKTLFAKIVELNAGENYIVTPKDSIISLTTNKIMKFLPNDGKRLKILALAKGVTSTQAVPYETMSAKDQWLNYGTKLVEKFGPGLQDIWEQRDQDFRNFKIKCL